MRDVFATGRIASIREQREHLEQRVAICTMAFVQHPSDHNEIERARAEQALADFLAAHPEPTR